MNCALGGANKGCPSAPTTFPGARQRPRAPGAARRRPACPRPLSSPAARAAPQSPGGLAFVTAANGLQYADAVVGSGPAVSKGQRLRCHYTGRLRPTGAKFDSSYDRKQPLSFTVGVGEVVAGWDLGILGSGALCVPPMREGGRRVLVVPPELGYGAVGYGRLIPPHATLEFDLELLPSNKLADAWDGALAQLKKMASFLEAV